MADSPGDAVTEMLASSEGLMAQVRELLSTTQGLAEQLDTRTRALRDAPMPYHESSLDIDGWLEAYSEWWHANASEEALGG